MYCFAKAIKLFAFLTLLIPLTAIANDRVPGSMEDFVFNIGDRVFFDYNSDELNRSSKATLERQAAWLQNYPTVTLTVEGHTDEKPAREEALKLGARRASAVRNYLISQGINRSRITTISYGKERPEVIGSNEEAWAQNRRAVSIVTSGAN